MSYFRPEIVMNNDCYREEHLVSMNMKSGHIHAWSFTILVDCFSYVTKDTLFHLLSEKSESLSRFITNHLDYFLSFDSVKIYYDNGQIPVTRILSSVFGIYLSNVQFKKAVKPSNYRLFQIADMLCSMELIHLKMNEHFLSKSELRFFKEPRVIRRKYLKAIEEKKMK